MVMFNKVTMSSLVASCVVVVTLSFSYAVELDATALKVQQVAFYNNIMTRLGTEHESLKPAIAKLNQSTENCNNVLLPAAQKVCQDCLNAVNKQTFGECKNLNIGERIGYGLGYVGVNFVKLPIWKEIGGWGGWNDMGNFLLKLNAWTKTGNFLPAGDWLINFGKDFLGWLARRRRDVSGLGMSALEFKFMRHHRAKRELNPKVKKCMEMCSIDCAPFLKDNIGMIQAVCGNQLLVDQTNVVNAMAKQKALYDANGTPTKGTLILSKMEYNQNNFDAKTFSFGEVYVTANTTSGVARYLSQYKYNMQLPQTSATKMAMELSKKWGV